jgi:hypothetical protein
MKIERKIRPDAVLDNLPEDRQAQLFAMMQPPENKSYAAVRKHLAKDGLLVSENLLSKWRSRYALRSACRQDEEDTQTLLEELKQEMPGLSDAQAFSLGQRIFSMLAIKREDVDTWRKVQTVQIRKDAEDRKKQEFQRETCALFVKWYADAKAREILQGDDSNDAKTEQLGQLIFKEQWK